MISKAKANRCVTHSSACDCREQLFGSIQLALRVIAIWAKHDKSSTQSRAEAMAAIVELAERGLEGISMDARKE